jgi:DNA-binding PadR family transcriptional regulator
MPRTPPQPPSLAERICLGLVCTSPEPVHGWALVRELAPDGAIGRIWSLSRPLTYRAIDQLVGAGLIRSGGQARGQGGERTLLAPTAAGSRVVVRWLDDPVAHLREVRTELLVKLAIAERAGRDTTVLIDAQRRAFAPLFAALAERGPDDVVDRWRQTSARAVRSFLEELRAENRRSAKTDRAGRRPVEPLP